MNGSWRLFASPILLTGDAELRNVAVASRASQLEATIVSVDQSRLSGNRAQEGASIYNLDDSTLKIDRFEYPAHSVHNPAAAKQ